MATLGQIPFHKEAATNSLICLLLTIKYLLAFGELDPMGHFDVVRPAGRTELKIAGCTTFTFQFFFWFIWFLTLDNSIEVESVICFKGERETVTVLICEFLLLTEAQEIMCSKHFFPL